MTRSSRTHRRRNRKHVGTGLLLLVIPVFCCAATVRAEHRVALLIGNSSYKNAALKSPRDDVKLLAAALEQHGFRTAQVFDANEDQLKEAVADFVSAAPTHGTAVVYFNGYTLPGSRKGQDGLFLAPLGIDFGNTRDLGNRGISVFGLLDELATRGGCDHNFVLVAGKPVHPQFDIGQEFKPLPRKLPAGCGLGMPTNPVKWTTAETSTPSAPAAKLSEELRKPRVDFVTALKAAHPWWLGDVKSGEIKTEGATPVVAGPDEFPQGKRAGDEWVNGRGMVFCWCPPGRFTMGTPEEQPRVFEDEQPVQVEFADGFWIGKYELTLRENPRGKPPAGVLGESKNHPVTLIHLDDARRMAEKTLTDSERKAGRLPADWEYNLPSAEEWEYAARAGTQTPFYFGSDINILPKHANFADRSLYDTGEFYFNYAHRTLDDGVAKMAVTGRYLPNPWGLHDVYGNAAEWCYSGEFRGGSYLSRPDYCRSALRNHWGNREQRDFLGFRLVIHRKR